MKGVRLALVTSNSLVILVDVHPRWDLLEKVGNKFLLEELAKFYNALNLLKTKHADLAQGSVLRSGIPDSSVQDEGGPEGSLKMFCIKSRTKLLSPLREEFQHFHSQLVGQMIACISPMLRGRE